MKKYDTYKDSGIEWLGRIPEHWKVKRIKDLFRDFGSGTTPKASNPKYYENGNIPWLNTSDLNNSVVSKTKIKITKEALNETGLKIYPKKSFAIAMYGQGKTRGTVGLIDFNFTTNQASCIMLEPKNIDSKYILYWFNYKYDDIRALNVGASQPNMNQEFVKFLQIQYPPIEEQTAIAHYLDTKTQGIDKKVNLLEKKIDYYKELRKSMINQAVTKGLDATVELKDSGIDWIGQIPTHWEVKRLKDLGTVETSSVNKKIVEDEEMIKLVNYTDVYGNSKMELWNNDDYMFVSAKQNQIINKNLKEGDVLFTPSSETTEDIGVSAVVMEDLNLTLYSYHLLRLRFRIKVALSFKKYLFNNDFVQFYMSQSATGTTRKILGLNTVYNTQIILPSSIEEQTAIAQYLDRKTQSIDKIVENINNQISTLKELRKTLINDVVTGKLRVYKPIENTAV